MLNFKCLALIFVFNLVSINNSFAYIDPGMGSIIIQSIIGGIAAGISFIAIYWQKFKNLFKRSKKTKVEFFKKK